MAHLTITPTTVTPGDFAILRMGTAGEAILAGQSTYYDADMEVWKLSASRQGIREASCDGIAVSSAAAGQPVTVQTDGVVLFGAGSGVVAGQFYCTTMVPGAIDNVLEVRITDTRVLIGCGLVGDALLLGRFHSGVLPGFVVQHHYTKWLFATTITNNTPLVSPIIDRRGYNSVTAFFATGTIVDVDATFTVLVEDGDNAALADAAPVADALLVSQTVGVAPELAASWGATDDGEVRKIGYMGTKDFLRVTVTPSLNTGDAPVIGYMVLESGDVFPVPADGT